MALVKLNNRGVRSVTDFGGTTALGTYTFIKKITASSSSTVSFVDGSSSVVLDDTYKEYLFTFKNIHPSASDPFFEINFSIDSGSNYNVAITSSLWVAYHNEGGSATGLVYNSSHDSAQDTDGTRILTSQGNGNDESFSGYMYLFNPSSTTFVKHFLTRVSEYGSTSYIYDFNSAGYGNTTSAIDAVQFAYNTGNIDAGIITLYGIN